MKKRDFLINLRQKTKEELRVLAGELKNELLKLRFDKALNKLAKTHLLREKRKALARVLTVIKEKEKNET